MSKYDRVRKDCLLLISSLGHITRKEYLEVMESLDKNNPGLGFLYEAKRLEKFWVENGYDLNETTPNNLKMTM